jgi:4-amino-4-deoxy-L-arabinose transferase-like glycosyltransferase
MLDYQFSKLEPSRLASDSGINCSNHLMAKTSGVAVASLDLSIVLLLESADDLAHLPKQITELEKVLAEADQVVEFVITSRTLSRQQLESAIDLGKIKQRVQLVDVESISEQNPISAAIQHARAETVAMIQRQFAGDDAQWSFLLRQLKNHDAIVCYESPVVVGRLRRLLSVGAELSNRMLLKTGFRNDRKGVVIANRTALDKLESVSSCPAPITQIAASLQAKRLASQLRVAEIKVAVDATDSELPLTWKQLLVEIGHTIKFWWNEIQFPTQQFAGRFTSASGDRIGSQIQADGQSRALQVKQVWSGIQKRAAPVSIPWHMLAWVVLLSATFWMLAVNLGYPLFEPDEARNAQIGMNIVSTGEWMTLRLGEEHYWDKPPLVAWLTAASYHVFGINAFATRLPCNLSAFLTVIIGLALGQRLIGFRAAWLGCLLLLFSTGFVVSGRYLTMDASLTLCTTTLLLSGYLAVQHSSRRFLLLAGIACGVGMLVKGPVVGVLGIPPLLVAAWLTGNRELFRIKMLAWLFVPTLLIAGPWFIAMTVAFFPDFAIYFFWKHHVVRFSDAFNHREPWWYYIPVSLLVMYPTSLLFPSLLAFLGSRSEFKQRLRTRELGFLALCTCWIIGFFSLSESKLPTYILPAFPMICLMVGNMLDKLAFAEGTTDQVGKWLKTMPQRVACSMTGLTLLGLVVCRVFLPDPHVPILLSGLIAIVLVCATALAFTGKNQRKLAWGSAGLLALIFVSFGTSSLIPDIAAQRSIHAAVSKVRTRSQYAESPVVFYRHENYGSEIWAQLHDQLVFGEDDLQEMSEYLLKHPDVLVVSTDGPVEELQQLLATQVKIVPSEEARHLYISEALPTRIAETHSERDVDNR